MRFIRHVQGQVVNPNNPFSFTFGNTGGGSYTSFSSSSAPSESYLVRARHRAIVCLLQTGDPERALAIEASYLNDERSDPSRSPP